MSRVTWLKEKEAAEKLERKPRTLRKKVLAGAWSIAYTCLNNRRYQYSQEDIEKLLLRNSTVVKQTRSATRQAQTVNS